MRRYFPMFNDKTILAIIPARGGSKSVPGKNLRMFNGKSLLAHAIETALSSTLIDKVIVSSEDEEILSHARAINPAVPFLRPHELAQDDSKTSDVVLHALENFPNYDYMMLLQVTSPLRCLIDINECLKFCLQNKANACASVTQTNKSPHWMFTIEEDKQTLTPIMNQAKFPLPHRRQLCQRFYILNGAIYIAQSAWFIQRKTFINEETIAYVMPQERSLDIDTEFDFKLLNLY